MQGLVVVRWFVDKVTTGSHLIGMKAAGIKELKARLSEYVRAVKAGETVLVTERGEVVAELRPPTGIGVPQPADVLESLAREGQITRARVAKEGWRWETNGLGLPAGTAASLLDELRAESGAGT